MPAIYSSQNSSLTNSSTSFPDALKDIVENITIQSTFCITHPHYKPLELTAKSVERFQKLPQNLQHKYLDIQLCAFLSGIYFTHSLRTILTTDEEIANSAQHKIEENNTCSGVDVIFFDRLHTNNYGQGFCDSGWQVLEKETSESDNLTVSKDELTLEIERDRHLYPSNQSTTVGELVSIKLPRNRVDSKNYIAIGNAGSHKSNDPNSEKQIVCIYLNFEAEGAVIFMAGLTQQLNELSIPFSLKVPYNTWDYKRCNSGKLYFNKQDYETIKRILQAIYLENQGYFDSECPFLTKILAPGVALAEEPVLKFAEDESFIKNRCQIIANALLETWQNSEDSADIRMTTIISHFHKNGIDLKQPYLNARSNDVYSSLNT